MTRIGFPPVLSGYAEDNGSSVRQLLRAAAEQRGHEIRQIVFDGLVVSIQQGTLSAADVAGQLNNLDALAPIMIGQRFPMSQMLAVWAEQSGVRTLNNVDAILLANDKMATHRRWAGANLPQPETVCSSSISALTEAAASFGYPVVVKPRDGFGGRMVSLAQDERELARLLKRRQARAWPHEPLIVQHYIRTSGKAMRAVVLDGDILTVTENTARTGDFRSNPSAGGKTRASALTSREIELVKEAVHLSGLRLAGLDLLRDGPDSLLLEVNAYPGLFAAQKATGVDLAGRIIDALAKDL